MFIEEVGVDGWPRQRRQEMATLVIIYQRRTYDQWFVFVIKEREDKRQSRSSAKISRTYIDLYGSNDLGCKKELFCCLDDEIGVATIRIRGSHDANWIIQDLAV